MRQIKCKNKICKLEKMGLQSQTGMGGVGLSPLSFPYTLPIQQIRSSIKNKRKSYKPVKKAQSGTGKKKQIGGRRHKTKPKKKPKVQVGGKKKKSRCKSKTKSVLRNKSK